MRRHFSDMTFDPMRSGAAFFSQDFQPLTGTARDCEDCGKGERLGFAFEYAYQPIVDLERGTVYAHEALVRGPDGEGAASVLAQVNENNRYRFDQACRVKAIKGASALGMAEYLSITSCPTPSTSPSCASAPRWKRRARTVSRWTTSFLK